MTWVVCCDRCQCVKDSPQAMPWGWRENLNSTQHYCSPCSTALETMRSPLATWRTGADRAAYGWNKSKRQQNETPRPKKVIPNRLEAGLARLAAS